MRYPPGVYPLVLLLGGDAEGDAAIQRYDLKLDVEAFAVGVSPGGPQDQMARMLQKLLTQTRSLDVPVAVVNKPGGVYLDNIVLKATVPMPKMDLPELPLGDVDASAARRQLERYAGFYQGSAAQAAPPFAHSA